MTPREFEQELDRLEPALTQAYLDQVATAIEQLSVSQIEDLISDRRESAVLQLVETGAFVAFLELLRSAYLRAQRLEISVLPKRMRLELGLVANPDAPRSTAWLGSAAQEMRTAAATAQREALLETFAAGSVAGRTARQVALDIIGRLQSTGRRSGGVVGLSGPEARAVARARAELSSGDPAQLRAYLLRQLRDRSADAAVRAALEAGRAVPAADVEQIVGRYAQRLLKARAAQIAKLRAHEVLGSARDHVFLAIADAGFLVEKVWSHRRDERVRESHRSMGGQKVPSAQPFRSGAGHLMQYPGDSSLGAPPSELIGCRCSATYRWRAA